MKHKYIKPLLDQIIKWSEVSAQCEICGFVGYDHMGKKFVLQLERNASLAPQEFFSIDPFNYLEFRDLYQFVAVFHSHVIGDEKPSEFDIKMAGNAAVPFLIYSTNSKKFHIYSPPNAEIDVNILRRLEAKV